MTVVGCGHAWVWSSKRSDNQGTGLPTVGTKSSGCIVAGSTAIEAKTKNTSYIKKWYIEEGIVTPQSSLISLLKLCTFSESDFSSYFFHLPFFSLLLSHILSATNMHPV